MPRKKATSQWSQNVIFETLDNYANDSARLVDNDQIVVPTPAQISPNVRENSDEPAYYAWCLAMHRLLKALPELGVDAKKPDDLIETRIVCDYPLEDWFRALLFLRYCHRQASDSKKNLKASNKQQTKPAIEVSFLTDKKPPDSDDNDEQRIAATQDVTAALDIIAMEVDGDKDDDDIDVKDPLQLVNTLDDYWNRVAIDDNRAGTKRDRPLLSVENQKKVMKSACRRIKIRNSSIGETILFRSTAGHLIHREELAPQAPSERLLQQQEKAHQFNPNPVLTEKEKDEKKEFWENLQRVSNYSILTPSYVESCELLDIDPDTRLHKGPLTAKEPFYMREWQIMGE